MPNEDLPRYLSVGDLLAFHRAAMMATNEPPQPLRDGHTGTLESGATRAQWAAIYEGADLIRQCALLAVGISDAQAFLDGNKRTALVVAEEFLDRNGWEFIGDDLEWAEQLKAASETQGQEKWAAVKDFEEWTRQHVRRKLG
jgi:death on curing protein